MNDDAKKALVDFQLSRLDRAEKVREEAEKAPRGISSFVSVLLLVGTEGGRICSSMVNL